MKKLLLSVALSAIAIVQASALTPTRSQHTVGQQTEQTKSGSQRKAPSANGFDLKMCSDIASWYYLLGQNSLTYDCYLYISPKIADQLAGNEVTEITLSTTTDYTTTKAVEVYVSEDREAAPAASGVAQLLDCYTLYQQGRTPTQSVALDEPYTIKAGQGFYIGYKVEGCRWNKTRGADYVVGVDGLGPSEYAGKVDLYNSSGQLIEQVDMATDLETNLFIAATTVGDKKTLENVFSIGASMLGEYTLAVTKANQTSEISLLVGNYGTNALKTIEYNVSVNGKDAGSYAESINVGAGTIAWTPVALDPLAAGRNDIAIKVTSINGVECDFAGNMQCITVAGEGYDRAMLVEEGTGAWCGWCPMGITGLRYMSEKYPDTFIPIAIHVSDQLQAASYLPFVNNVFSSFPSCIVNRDFIYDMQPSVGLLEEAYTIWQGQRAPVKVDLKVDMAEDLSLLRAYATTTFDYDDAEGDYKLAYVVIEDGLYEVQTNNYSGRPSYADIYTMEWVDKPSSLAWEYEDTAVDIFSAYGIDGSIPAGAVKGVASEHVYTIPATNITNVDNTSIIAMVLDGATGTVLNATRVKAEDYGIAGIDNVLNDSNQEAVYYNLQGMRVANPQGGVYIKRQGGKAAKVVL